jgi:hypothetical protein
MIDRFPFEWQQLSTIPQGQSFICGFCGSNVSSDKSYQARHPSGSHSWPYIFICHICNRPTFIYNDQTTPSAPLGSPVNKLPKDIGEVYNEIRQATSVASYTAAVLAARKLLMHIAVEKGAETDKSFVDYVNYLDQNHYTPPNSKGWVDKIRQLGNEANHDIVIMSRQQAQLILIFLEMLLKFIYEFPDEEHTILSEQDQKQQIDNQQATT